MTIDQVKQHYTDIVQTQSKVLSDIKNTIFRIGTIRLIIALLCIILSYVTWGNSGTVGAIITVSLVLFLFFMNKHSQLFRKKRYTENLIKNAQNELKGLDYDFSAFDGASEKIDAEHSYSLDLDLFGERSFFQSLNRTVTSFGKNSLADTLIFPLTDNAEIINQQKAVQELSTKNELLSHFRATGQMNEDNSLNTKNFAESFVQPILLYNSSLWKYLIYIIPAIYIVMAFLVGCDIISGTWFAPLYILTFGLSAIPSKKVGIIKDTFEQKSAILDTYAKLLRIIENEEFESHELKSLQNNLSGSNKASRSIGQLKSLHGCLEMAFAYPILLLLNPILLWNVKYAIAIEKWIEQHKNEIDTWFATLAKFDSLVSTGMFAFNHPDYTYPTPKDCFVFEGKALGHPMIRRDVCVKNDVSITKSPYFLVVTGANMAGKSTYLRTIGINHTLACAGMPVCAEELVFYPNHLVTNLRTADSLADNESYFFAELKRLKMIIDRLQSGEEIFIILDEILKGTNSEDKRKGSIALMKQLISLNGNGIIATHDLELGNLEKEYPQNIKNYCFEADITDDKLSFTYQMREGVAQNMNASFLMRKMGITGV